MRTHIESCYESYSTKYQQNVHYGGAQTTSLVNSIEKFHWKRELGVLGYDPNLQVNLLTHVITNIFTISFQMTTKL